MIDTTEFNAVLSDADPIHSGSLPTRVVANHSALSIFPQGYGDFGSADGQGYPIFLELYRGRLRLVVFADINEESPTHIIELEVASEDCGIEIE